MIFATDFNPIAEHFTNRGLKTKRKGKFAAIHGESSRSFPVKHAGYKQQRCLDRFYLLCTLMELEWLRIASSFSLISSRSISLELSWQLCRCASSDPCHAHRRPLSFGDPKRSCSALLPACIKQIQSNNFGSCIIKMPRTTCLKRVQGGGAERAH